eukprot:gene15115-15258_t
MYQCFSIGYDTHCWNNQETKLITGNVNTKGFGKLFSLSVDDQVYAQPLIFGGLSISGAQHNVVFIATVNNTVYAYDGDSGSLYWKKNFNATGMRAPKNTDMTGACGGSYQDFSGNIGIVGTPVIDSASQTMYFVARNTDGQNFSQYLHAINITNGSEQTGSPVKITASMTGSGDGSVNNVVSFDPQRNNQRAALTLLNGIIYVSFSSHCDWGPYHGWILGYNSKTLAQQIIYNDTPNGSDGGIWESGMGMAADAQGNLYVVVGNGTVGQGNDPTNFTNRGESALKLTPAGNTLQVNSYFTPYNFPFLEANDLDYGSMGALLIPGSNYYVTGAKDGNIYVLNKDNMGGYNPTSNQVISNVSGPTGQNGAVISVSSNGSTDGTGIVWASYASSGDAEHTVSPGILRAFDARDVTKELWNSSQNGTADQPGYYAKFSSPTVANGHVYLPTFSNQLFIGGFPLDITELELVQLVSPYGTVNTIKIVRDKKSGKCKGYAFLEMKDQTDAESVIDALDGSPMRDKTGKIRRTVKTQTPAKTRIALF